jgi:hypothetical protein
MSPTGTLAKPSAVYSARLSATGRAPTENSRNRPNISTNKSARETRPDTVTAELAGILLPVFCLAGVGYVWRRLGYPFEREFVTNIIMNVAGPCLIVDSLSHLSMPADEFLVMVLAAVAMLLSMVAAAFVGLKAARLPVRSFLPALAIGNTGNLGLLSVSAAWGWRWPCT